LVKRTFSGLRPTQEEEEEEEEEEERGFICI
jgi:hypothetical protein